MSNGLSLTTVTIVNTMLDGNQEDVDITALASGGAVLAWESFNGDAFGDDLSYQIIDAEGAALLTFPGAITSVGAEGDVAATALLNGGFALAWQLGPDGQNANSSIQIQSFSAQGAVATGAVTVTPDAATDQTDPELTTLPDGSIVLVYGGSNSVMTSFTPSLEIVNTFDFTEAVNFPGVFTIPESLGSEVSAALVVTNETFDSVTETATLTATYYQSTLDLIDVPDPDIAFLPLLGNTSGGSAAFTETAVGYAYVDGTDLVGAGTFNVYAEFGLLNASISGPILIDSDVGTTFTPPRIAALQDGTFVVVWDAPASAGFGTSIYVQRVSADGTLIGEALEVSAGEGFNDEADIAVLGSGDLLIAWEADLGTDSENDIYQAIVSVGDLSLTLIGDETDEMLTGSTVGDVIDGAGGNDTLLGAEGNDIVSGGPGDDVVQGGLGDDTVSGGSGNDTLLGSAGSDLLTGDSGDDLLLGGTGADTMIGGDGLDVFSGNVFELNGSVISDFDAEDGILVIGAGGAAFSFAFDQDSQILALDLFDDGIVDAQITLEGVESGLAVEQVGPDLLLVLAENESITGTDANETLPGGPGNDIINAGGGNDFVQAGQGNDLISAGAGDDQVTAGQGDDTVSGGLGNDNISASDGDDSVDGGAGNDSLGGGDGNDILNGGVGNDIIGGGNGNDTIDAGAGDDNMSGGFGADIVRGGDGNDTMAGSFGADLVEGQDGNDQIGGGGGIDTLNGDAGDDAIGGGDGGDLISGGLGNDFIGGGAGNDVIFGNEGNDTINGGEGSDVMRGGAGADIFVFNDITDGELDFIYGFEDGTDKIRMQLSALNALETDGFQFQDLTITAFTGATGINFAQIEIGGHTIRLGGMAPELLSANDFIFV